MKLLLFFLCCVLLLIQIHESINCFTDERTALLDIKAFLYNQMDQSSHRYDGPLVGNYLSSWIYDPKSDCCKWNHVTCNPFSGHVINLHLQDFRIQGIHNGHVLISNLQRAKKSQLVQWIFPIFDSYWRYGSINPFISSTWCKQMEHHFPIFWLKIYTLLTFIMQDILRFPAILWSRNLIQYLWKYF